MHCRRGMANQGFRSAETDRQFEYLKAIEESERVRLISFDVEGECRAGRVEQLDRMAGLLAENDAALQKAELGRLVWGITTASMASICLLTPSQSSYRHRT